MKHTAKITRSTMPTGEMATLTARPTDHKYGFYCLCWHTENRSLVQALASDLQSMTRQMTRQRLAADAQMVEYYDRQIEVARALLTAAMSTDKVGA